MGLPRPPVPGLPAFMRRVWTRMDDSLEAYLRMLHWRMEREEREGHAACFVFRLPAPFVEAALDLLRCEYPAARHYVITRYNREGRVLVWRVPDDPEARREPTTVQ